MTTPVQGPTSNEPQDDKAELQNDPANSDPANDDFANVDLEQLTLWFSEDDYKADQGKEGGSSRAKTYLAWLNENRR